MADIERSIHPRHRARGWLVRVLLWLPIALVACTTESPTAAHPLMTFTLTLFDGSQRHSADLQGQTLVVNFWASWCQPCREEMPELQRVWQAYRDQGVVFVGVVLKGDDQNAAQAFLREAGIAYPNGQDDEGTLATNFHVVGLPNTFILSQEGRLVHRFIGPVTAARLRQRLEQALTL